MLQKIFQTIQTKLFRLLDRNTIEIDYSALLLIVAATTSLGLFFGSLEGIIQWIRWLLDSTDPMGQEILWAAPLVYGLVAFLLGWLVGIVVICINRFWIRSSRFAYGLMIGLFFGFCVIGYYQSLSLIFSSEVWALGLLAVGLAYQSMVFVSERPKGMLAYMSRCSLWLAGYLAIVYIGLSSISWLGEKRIVGNLPPASLAAPNVIFITLDTVRADHLGVYGYERLTPNLDRFAQEGILFDAAVATSSWTLPSHATLMTGLYTHDHEADTTLRNRLDDEFYTLAEAFTDNGYLTAAFVANSFACTGNLGFEQGFSHFEDLFWNFEDTIRLTAMGAKLNYFLMTNPRVDYYQLGRKPAEEVNDEFLSWLPEDNSRPFFVWLNYFDPHDPYQSPDPFNIMYGSKPANGDPGSFGAIGASNWGGILSPEEITWQTDAYDSTLAYLDYQLGVLFQQLQERGMYDSTIIVITSDHGEAFGEHQLYGHANSLYREALHVPLFIRYPQVYAPGEVIIEPVSLVDLPATIVTLANLKMSQAFPGNPLGMQIPSGETASPVASELAHNPYHPASHPVSKSALFSITTPDWHLIASKFNLELFSLADQYEQSNLAKTDAGRLSVQAILDQYASWLEKLSIKVCSECQ